MSKTILITGCSSGIGLHCAQRLKEDGHRVFATARKIADVEMLLEQGFESVQLDLSNAASVDSGLNTVLDRTNNELFALFNNGAYGQPGAVEDLTRDVIREQFETNLFGTMQLTNKLIPLMRKQGYGRIIHNSSVLGLVSLPFRGAYNASKYALEGFADTQRLELHNSGVYISLIEPGPITSKFRENAFRKYQENIVKENSFFKEKYQAIEERLKKEGPAAPFTLGPEAVYTKLLHALDSEKPKSRYYVTFPTYLLGTLKRLLPGSGLDWVLRKISADEN